MNGSTRSYEFAKRLTRMGHEVNLITSWREEQIDRQWKETRSDGFSVHWFPIMYSNLMRNDQRIKAFAEFIYYAGRKAVAIKSDVIFASSTPLTIALPGIYAARKLKIPMVLEVRDLWPQAPIAIGALSNPITIRMARWLEKFAYKHSKHIVSLSPNMTEHIQGLNPAVPVTEIPNVSDIERFDPENANRDWLRSELPGIGAGPLVTYAGTLGRVNDAESLVHVAKAALDQELDIQFLIIGDGIEKKKIHERASELGVLDRNLTMAASVPKRDMPNVLAATDLSLSLVADIPELWGNSANKFFDALASGTPIGINHSGWQAEIINKHQVGLVLPTQDPNSSAKMLEQFFADPSISQECGEAARRLATEKFEVNMLTQKLDNALSTAVGITNTQGISAKDDSPQLGCRDEV